MCALEIWCEALERRKSEMRKTDAREINTILEQTPGWERIGLKKAGAPYGPQRCFQRIPTA